MIQTMFRKLSLRRIPILFALIVFTCLLIVAGCTQEKQGEQLEVPYGTKEKNIQIVEAVLKHEFSGPDKEFSQIVNKDGQEKSKEINSYLNSKYEPYFTASALENFIYGGAYVYQYQNKNQNYQMSIEELKVKQSDKENGDNIYYFNAKVALESPNEKKTLYEITGEAIFSKEGKIGKFQIVDKNQELSDKLNGISDLD